MIKEEKNKVDKKKEKTKSFIFILPMLGETISDFIDVANCYIADSNRPEYTNHIFILFDYNSSKTFSKFEEQLIKNRCFVDYYDPNPKQVMFIFRVPMDWQKEYNLFKEGKAGHCYSAFKEIYKQHILTFLAPQFDIAGIKGILYKEELRYQQLEKDLGMKVPRDVEPYAVPNLKDETYVN